MGALNLCEQDRVKLLLYAHTIKSDFESHLDLIEKRLCVRESIDCTVPAGEVGTATTAAAATAVSVSTHVTTDAVSIDNGVSTTSLAEAPTRSENETVSTATATILSPPVLTKRKKIRDEDLIALEEDQG